MYFTEDLHKELNSFLLEISKSNSFVKTAAKDSSLKASIIIPFQNTGSKIRACLESIGQQTISLDRIEVICIDNGSTDDTSKIVNEYLDRIPNLKLIKPEANKKNGAVKNLGIKSANGEYVLFLNPNHYLRLDALERCIYESKENDLIVSQIVYDRFDEPFERIISNRKIQISVIDSFISGALGLEIYGLFIKRSVITENKIQFSEQNFYEDIKFIIHLYSIVNNITIINEQTYYYISHKECNPKEPTEQLKDFINTIKEHFTHLDKLTERQNITWNDYLSNWVKKQLICFYTEYTDQLKHDDLIEYFIIGIKNNEVLSKYLESNKKEIEELLHKQKENNNKANSQFFIYKPWGNEYKNSFSEKIIFYCEVDYHVRASAEIIRELKKHGYNSLVIDSSISKNFPAKRTLHPTELKSYSDIEIKQVDVSTSLPFNESARAYIFMNDLAYTRRLILENFGIGVPTIGIYEGINDNLNNDRVSLARKPYRSLDHLLLPGIYEYGFFKDKSNSIIGLPNIYNIWKKTYAQPTKKLVIINVNFTYGVLEERRDMFVESAVSACNDLNIPYIISQHPADKSDLSKYNVSKETIYELLTKGCLLISRFSTTILEALAMGRAAIYHNPINEKVPKFQNSLGAYSISKTTEELKQCIINELYLFDEKIDIKKRAAIFLHFHCNVLNNRNPSEMAAKEIIKAINKNRCKPNFKISRGKL